MQTRDKIPDLQFSVKKAHAVQQQLSTKLVLENAFSDSIQYVAGVDVAYAQGISIGAAVVLDYPTLSFVESQVVHTKTRFPYIPTLLSYREIPPCYSVIKKLQLLPDVILVDGHGLAHPYRFGLASHLGLILDHPTIGVAKRLLYGQIEPAGEQAWRAIRDNDEIIGAELRFSPKTKPIYVSIGHRIALERAVNIVGHCIGNSQLPEPLRQAHILASKEKKRFQE